MRLVAETLAWDTEQTEVENYERRARIWRRLERLASVGYVEARAALREAGG